MASNTYSQGAQVEHLKFGLGTVLSSSEERIVIKFDDHGEKKFVTTLVMGSLKKSDRAAPVEKRVPARKRQSCPLRRSSKGLEDRNIVERSQKRLFEEARKRNPDLKIPTETKPANWSEADLHW